MNYLLFSNAFIVITTATVLAYVTICRTAQPIIDALADLNYTTDTTFTFWGLLLPQVSLPSTIIYTLNPAGSTARINGRVVYNKIAAEKDITTIIRLLIKVN